jgi:hypothetical protein
MADGVKDGDIVDTVLAGGAVDLHIHIVVIRNVCEGTQESADHVPPG